MSGKFDGPEDEEWNREENRENERIQARHNAENKYEAEQRFYGSGRECEEVVRVPFEAEKLHEIPVVVCEKVDAEFGMQDFLGESECEECRAGANAQERQSVFVVASCEMRERTPRHEAKVIAPHDEDKERRRKHPDILEHCNRTGYRKRSEPKQSEAHCRDARVNAREKRDSDKYLQDNERIR